VRVGAAISQALAGAGYRVWVHYCRSQGPAEVLAATLGGACLGLCQGDLADEGAREALCRRVLEEGGPAGGRVDLLVNNAASFERGEFLRRSDAELRRVHEVNFVAPVSLTRGLVAALARAKGAVVNILDVAALQPWRGYLDHCTAKAALAMATRALAVELAPAVRVNGVAPGTVAWPEDERYAEGSEVRARILRAIPLGRIGTPEEIARTVLFLAESSFITGQVVVVDGGRTAGAAVE